MGGDPSSADFGKAPDARSLDVQHVHRAAVLPAFDERHSGITIAYPRIEYENVYNPLMAYIDRSFIDSSSDDKLLRAFVTTAVRVVSAFVNGDSWIVPPDNPFQPPEARGWFQENWKGFKEAADRVVNSLRDIKEDVWEKLRNAGLTWGHLRMKWQLWFEDLLSGRFNDILRRLNSILKSLATAIPLGECLGEYKEHVEMTLKNLQNLNFGDATGLIDLSSAE